MISQSAFKSMWKANNEETFPVPSEVSSYFYCVISNNGKYNEDSHDADDDDYKMITFARFASLLHVYSVSHIIVYVPSLYNSDSKFPFSM